MTITLKRISNKSFSTVLLNPFLKQKSERNCHVFLHGFQTFCRELTIENILFSKIIKTLYLIHTWSDKAFTGTDVNQENMESHLKLRLQSLQGPSLPFLILLKPRVNFCLSKRTLWTRHLCDIIGTTLWHFNHPCNLHKFDQRTGVDIFFFRVLRPVSCAVRPISPPVCPPRLWRGKGTSCFRPVTW